MTARTSGDTGLQRDIRLIRRRAWLFIPFLLLGIVVALAYGSLAGNANAVATMQLQTVVHDLFAGGDRGFRIYEADAMTRDDEFKKRVKEALGNPDFDYARFTISLFPISVADGVSQGTLTVSIKDPDLAKAQKYRDTFVSVFTREYKEEDGLFRVRFVGQKQKVLVEAEKRFYEEYAKLKQMTVSSTLPIDALAQYARGGGLVDELGKQEADLSSRQQEAQSAIDALAGASPAAAAAVASGILGQAVPSGEGLNALNAWNTSLKASILAVRKQRASYQDGNLDPALASQLNIVRNADSEKLSAADRVQGARLASVAGESNIDTSLSASGGLAGSPIGKVAIVLAVTVVFGLIAIYSLEWLSQVRANTAD